MQITIFLLIITSVVSVLAFQNRGLFDKLKFNAYMIVRKKEIGRVFSHALIHADWTHLIINMLVLYMFGSIAEEYFSKYFPKFGQFLYILMYVLAVAAATIPALLKHNNNHSYNSVGASGAVSAVLFASILFDPTSSVYFFFIPIPIPSPIFGIIYLGYSYYMNKKGRDNIAHDAHFAGSIFGFFFPILLKFSLFKIFFMKIYLEFFA